MVLGQQMNRPIVGPAEALVDPLGRVPYAVFEQTVFLERTARGGGDLHVGQTPDPLRVLIEQPLHRMYPFQNSLGVVEALDADGKHLTGLQPETLARVEPS